jgi:D-glycero-D-manno-heptose 1,7-bisphosphate phosphatase
VRAAAFLDRDGVLNALAPDPVTGAPESPLEPAEVRLLPGAADGARRLRDAGYVLIGVTNQPGAAKGFVTTHELALVHERVLALLEEQGVSFDGFEICPHHPDGVVAALSGECDCRKPAPGMLLKAASEHDLDLGASWMIGDTDTDVAAGLAAGCHTLLIEHRASAHKRGGGAPAELRAPDLLAAAAMILSCG